MQSDDKDAPPASTPAASRFAYDVLTNEDEAVKAPNVRRGKDGHVALGGTGDFFSDPMGTSASGGSPLGTPSLPIHGGSGAIQDACAPMCCSVPLVHACMHACQSLPSVLSCASSDSLRCWMVPPSPAGWCSCALPAARQHPVWVCAGGRRRASPAGTVHACRSPSCTPPAGH